MLPREILLYLEHNWYIFQRDRIPFQFHLLQLGNNYLAIFPTSQDSYNRTILRGIHGRKSYSETRRENQDAIPAQSRGTGD